MGSDTPSAATSALPLGRLIGVGLIVFLANAALLVLQLVAGRLLAPFVGSSLETWTSVIGVFLAGIALGNGFGGKLADRYPTPRTLAVLLLVGAIAAIWMAIFPLLLASSGVYKSIPLGPRIPLLAALLCLPAGLVLSLLTPLAIKLGLPDVSRTGRVAGMVFALSTLGCLLGNYLTGFVLIPMFTINTLVFVAAGALVVLSLGSVVVMGNPPDSPGSSPAQLPGEETSGNSTQMNTSIPSSTNPYAFTDIRLAFTIVFLASFGGMTLELTASRVLAQFLGVSLFTWTGIIGVMLAGTALGNFTGGWIADQANRPGNPLNPRFTLAGSLLVAGAGTVFQFVALALVTRYGAFDNSDPIMQVVGWTFCLFFLPMFALGTISPQVIRLSVPDVAHVGQVAGRVYAWSTAGAIAGTFVAGYVLLSAIGMNKTILCISLILTLTSLLVTKVWNNNPLLYVFSIVLGGITGGAILNSRSASHNEDQVAQLETNYYTIKVTKSRVYYSDYSEYNGLLTLTLDHLIHSSVHPDNPFFLYYKHEHVQMEFLRGARKENPNPRVLVVGGGGYTFPRFAMELMPEARMDVVEIDPGVTWMAKNHLGLKDYEGLKIHHMDGRQYVAEKVPPSTYDLVVQDAVNDLSVPSHLLTKEYNDAVKAALKPNGVYLLTVIDSIGYGQLWKAAMLTLQQTYPAENIALLTPEKVDFDERQVYVIYASDRPLDLPALRAAVGEQILPGFNAANQLGSGAARMLAPGGVPHTLAIAPAGSEIVEEEMNALFQTRRVPQENIQPYLDAQPRIILTDQYAPVDNLMAEVFRYRYRKRPK